MIAITWSNGSMSVAKTWQALEDRVRAEQWHLFDEDEFREAMQKRCWRWSHTRIDIDGDSEHFFQELARARLITIDAVPPSK